MVSIILDNLRSKHNVGAIFRTADATGVECVYLCGTTPQPLDRFRRPVTAIHKTALGAELSVPHQYSPDTETVVSRLQARGTTVWAVEQSEAARDLLSDHSLEFAASQPVAFVFGNEVDGVSSSVIGVADGVLSLPMLGKKESLNVSVAVGAVLYLFQAKINSR